MSTCTKKDMSNLLHAYELNLLTDEELDLFETHLLSCDRCFEEVKVFLDESRILYQDQEVRQVVGQAAKPAASPPATLLQKLRRFLWPEVPLVARPALVYMLLLLMVVPAYRGMVEWMGPIEDSPLAESPQIEAVHQLRTIFVPSVRDGSDLLISRKEGDKVALVFQFWSGTSGMNFPAVVTSLDGDIPYRKEEMITVDLYDQGGLGFYLPLMNSGRYQIEIGEVTDDPFTGTVCNFQVVD